MPQFSRTVEALDDLRSELRGDVAQSRREIREYIREVREQAERVEG